MSDVTEGAHTLEEIRRFCRGKKYGCFKVPLFNSVAIVNIVPDTLHLYLRTADQLVYHIIKYLQDVNNFKKLTEKKLKTSVHLSKFQNFIKDIGINDWRFLVKDGKLDYDTFTRPEHRAIISNINLDYFIPQHPKLSQIKELWSTFSPLLDELDQDMSNEEINKFQEKAKIG